MVSNVYLHFFRQNRLCFQAIPGICQRNCRKFCFGCKQWSVYYGFQCFFSFFSSKQILFPSNSRNWPTEFRKFCFVCKQWIVYYGFQCLFKFFSSKQTLFPSNSRNWLTVFRKFYFVNIGLFFFSGIHIQSFFILYHNIVRDTKMIKESSDLSHGPENAFDVGSVQLVNGITTD